MHVNDDPGDFQYLRTCAIDIFALAFQSMFMIVCMHVNDDYAILDTCAMVTA
jgi:hypothetical protein